MGETFAAGLPGDTESANGIEQTDVGGELYQLMRLMRRYWHEGVASLELTGPQTIVLAGINTLGDGANQTELSQYTGIHKAPLACIIDQLEDKGYVERRLDPRDRRVRRIFATESVQELSPRMQLVTDGLNASLTKGVQQDDLQAVIRCIATMRENLLVALGESDSSSAREAELI